MKPKHALRPNDVVKIMHPAIPTFGSKTGVVNRVDALTGMVNVFPKGVDIGIRFETKYLKRIGTMDGLEFYNCTCGSTYTKETKMRIGYAETFQVEDWQLGDMTGNYGNGAFCHGIMHGDITIEFTLMADEHGQMIPDIKNAVLAHHDLELSLQDQDGGETSGGAYEPDDATLAALLKQYASRVEIQEYKGSPNDDNDQAYQSAVDREEEDKV